ncbi:MAG: class I SAM-dependent methyltransferase [Chitinophagales bacterium]|nr:class I SAM-dependent methyltransferase [Chitinophagales bacterium]MDW8394107.1 class I SAM-dependent methyltransferase [Chitinophagales bacterium]
MWRDFIHSFALMAGLPTAYENPEWVFAYGRLRHLFAAERRFLERNGNRLATCTLLDVGIGAGRTTLHFAPAVARYVGIDYSEEMIRWCRNHFPASDQTEFHVMDARQLAFPDHTFDVVLFSFNGIDCVPYEDRNRVLGEFFRVLKSKGTLLFSFHNARSVRHLYSLQMPRNPFKIPWELRRRKKLRTINGPWQQYIDKNYFHIYDGSDDFQTRVCYVAPHQQWQDLMQLGFVSVQASNLETGRLIPESQRTTTTDQWIFVETQKP